MGFLTRCKRLFSFAFLLQNRNTFFSFFLKSFLILSEKQHSRIVDLTSIWKKNIFRIKLFPIMGLETQLNW